MRLRLVWVACAWLVALPARAQQPFVVDDASVTPGRVWHLEVSNEADALKPAARPAHWQNALEWELALGLPGQLEVGVVVPVISLSSDIGGGDRATANGIGDSTLAAKYRFTRRPDARTSWAGSVSLELPTGSRARQLGSGLVDYGAQVVAEHRLTTGATLRINGGAVLAGNTQVGVLGIAARGTVLTSGVSLVAAVSRRVQAGAELTGAWSQKAVLAGSTVGWQIGGNVLLREGVTLDLGVLGGWFDSSPRFGLQVGTSIDLRP